MDLLWVFSVLCLLCLCSRLFICALWSPAGKGLTSWLSFVVSYFPIGILGQVCYLIVSITDICTLTYFVKNRYVFVLSAKKWFDFSPKCRIGNQSSQMSMAEFVIYSHM